jgi:hypothetical protein
MLAAWAWLAAAATVREVVVTNDLELEQGAQLAARLIVRAGYVTVDGNGATLVGPGQVADPNKKRSCSRGAAPARELCRRNRLR